MTCLYHSFPPRAYSRRQFAVSDYRLMQELALILRSKISFVGSKDHYVAFNYILIRLSGTGVNPAGYAGDTSPQYFGWGTSTGISPQYYYVLSDIADQYWLPSVRSASSRFHSAIRRHQFASVRQADSRLTRLVPPTWNSR